MQVTVSAGPVDPVASNASGYIVAGSFADGQEVSDSAARPQSANANIEVLRCKHLISAKLSGATSDATAARPAYICHSCLRERSHESQVC